MQPRHATRTIHPRRSARSAGRAVALGLAFAGAIATAALSGAPALGAQAEPTITVEAVHPLGGGSFHFIVLLADGNGDPLTGTTVTATPTSPGGTTGAVTALPSGGDGTYQGPVPLPEDGTWTVRITSADPAGAIDYGYQVTGDTGTAVGTVGTTQPADTTAPPTTATPTTAPGTTAPTTSPATTAATTTTIATETDETAARADDDDDGGFPVILLIVGAALVVALAGVPLALRTIQNANTAGPSDSTSDADDPDGTGRDGA